MAVTSMRADAVEPAVLATTSEVETPAVDVPGDDAPVRRINKDQMRMLGINLSSSFNQYRSDRRVQEERWLRNLRQYLGFYDPEVERGMLPNRSRAYPKLTRVKCISMLSRIMDLMFPSDDRNWTLTARPSADMDVKDVQMAIQTQQAADAQANNGQAPPLTKDYVTAAVMKLAEQRAKALAVEIDDQLEELGGDQSYDYIALNSEVVAAGIMYGIGILRGPYVREQKTSTWEWDEGSKQPVPKKMTKYMPQFEFLNIWDFYPDLAAKRLEEQEGYFTRVVMSKKQVRDLVDRPNFFGDVIKSYLQMYSSGDYKAQEFETTLRTMGVKVNINDQKSEAHKYEIKVWHGPIDADMLIAAGVEVPQDKRADMIDAEVWLLGDRVICAMMNPYAEMDMTMQTLHFFMFDRDDTSPIGFGLPNVMRDTQMSIAASARMLLDNASVCCGPILEMNTNLLRADQDVSAVHAYKTFYRDDDGQTAQFPAVRQIQVDSHIPELSKVIELFMKLADIETFVGPATGGDMERMPSEPMRNAAGASMMLGNAALPFKQIIRNFDKLTKSVIQSLVQFNRKFNPDIAPIADYDVIARGASSLIAKEVRGMQVDQLAATLKPEEAMHVDMRKLVAARFKVRDLDDMLVSEDEAARRQSVRDQAAQLDKQLQQAGIEANTRYLLSQAFKNIAQGQKNQVGANAEAVDTALAIMEKGAALNGLGKTALTAAGNGPSEAVPALPPGTPPQADPGLAPQPGGAGAVPAGGM